VDKAFEARVREYFLAENFVLDQLSPGIQYPHSYEDAINQKNKAIQDQMRVENEVAVANAEAEKKIAIARGNAEALKIKADAEAYYNRVVSASLSSNLVQLKALEKWNGATPAVASSGTFIETSKFIK
jgi:regulator of protease activity HflC (stomatin/prohibitin superfamily)